MPEPVRSGQRYLPGLDGLRAIAVLAVVAYHIGLGWAQGGLLGVGVFFTLSGYIITDLLLGQQARTGSLQLADFWLRRARRLLPALFVMLTVVVGWVALFDRTQLAALRGMVASAALYVSNWWLIAQHQSYFSRFGPPSPLGHLWSLAVEEQFYLVWPWLVLLGLRLYRGRRRASDEYYGLAVAALVLAAVSATAMALLFHPGFDQTRIYEGTDTRAFGLLIGAALAFVWPSRKLRASMSKASTRCLDGIGVVGLLVIGALVWRTTEYSAFLYQGGLVLLSVATALVVAAVAAPASRVGRVLGIKPLRWIGVRSYGIYLWHYPIIVLTTPANGGESLARGAAQLAASVAAAALSWRFIEEPIRHGAIGRLWARLRGSGWRAVQGQGWAALGVSSVTVVAAACGLAGAVPAVSPGTPVVSAASASSLLGTSAGQTVDTPPSGLSSFGPPAPPAAPESAAQLLTSCRSVVHIGDSTSDGLVLPAYQPDPALRIAAQYQRVGVTTFIPEVSGARSIVETWHGFPNGYTVAEQLIDQGYHGCWVIALGTNDAADVAVGSNVGLPARIQRMMSLIGDQPVMWVNVISLLASGPYSDRNMQQWNQALLQACPSYPNMRVYDWAAAAKPSWFIPDGIHYNPQGYAERSRLIADALAHAFPRTQPGWSGITRMLSPAVTDVAFNSQPSCLVH